MRDQDFQQGPGLIFRFLTAPWLWAAGSTWLFYSQLHRVPVGQDLLQRYFCGHPLERVLAGLFFVGLSIIGVKTVLLLIEKRALRLVPDFGVASGSEDLAANVARFKNRLTSFAGRIQNTYWGRRLEHLLAFFQGRKSGDGLNEHLTYLEEAAADRLHASHSLLQTVIWSIPILGFLGTVMGITLAIANVTPDQLDTSLDEVTNGLAVAFDTTALALSLSLILGFASLFIKRAEESLLGQIAERCRLEVHRCFPVGSAHNQHPLLEAETQASQALLDQTAALIAAQTSTWSSTLDELRQKWTATLAEQQAQLSAALVAGADQTLSDHSQQLHDYREQFVVAQGEMSKTFVNEIEALAKSRTAADAELLSMMETVAQKLTGSVESNVERQNERLTATLDAFATRIEDWQASTEAWQKQMGRMTSAIVNQSDVLLQHGGQLEQIVGQEASLLKLQAHLAKNLETIQTAETFEQTLNNLTAAVHLLTARHRTRDAA